MRTSTAHMRVPNLAEPSNRSSLRQRGNMWQAFADKRDLTAFISAHGSATVRRGNSQWLLGAAVNVVVRSAQKLRSARTVAFVHRRQPIQLRLLVQATVRSR